jgi:hypothetical protein
VKVEEAVMKRGICVTSEEIITNRPLGAAIARISLLTDMAIDDKKRRVGSTSDHKGAAP